MYLIVEYFPFLRCKTIIFTTDLYEHLVNNS